MAHLSVNPSDNLFVRKLILLAGLPDKLRLDRKTAVHGQSMG